jgi:phosphatidylserine/phosphatidylglycerophosphate/cardiolipin synthase-like enzyme
VREDWYTVLFTEPGSLQAKKYRGGPDQALAEAIHNARLSVDLAVYSLNLWSLRDALLAANQRGVQVRLLTDQDNLDYKEIGEIRGAGIPVVGADQVGIMHNKFTIIDNLEVWTGSMNYTVEGAYRENNNLIRVHSAQLAQDYSTEFKEMFIDGQFGPDSPQNTPYPQMEIDESKVEVYFSPEDHPRGRLLQIIQGAKKSIYFMAYSFTSENLAGMIIGCEQAGVTVKGVMEENQVITNEGGQFNRLKQAGIDVKLDGNLHSMHHKVMVIDQQIVVTGSYNFSQNAEELNDENVLIITNPGIASLYLEEFNRVYTQAKDSG